MSIILNIDTSLETASISIAADGIIQSQKINSIQKEHASFIHGAIKELLAKLSININSIDAISVTNGPGSYTGLRVGLASAKGLCFALNKPLITLGSLNVLANAATNEILGNTINESVLFCPMIDARRMEVYTAVFDRNMHEHLSACAIILDQNSFAEILEKNKVFFFGNGSLKWENISKSTNAHFVNPSNTINSIAELSFKKYTGKNFSNLIYSEPLYVKEFFTP